MRNTVILLSCVAIIAAVACEPETKRRNPISGTAGTSGGAGTTGVAGTTAAAGTTGQAGTGAAGDSAVAGTTGQAGTGAAGDSAVAGTTGQAGTGAAGDSAAAGTTGAAGTGVAMVCDNAAVVTAGGDETKCGAKTGWTATAVPTPPSGHLGINNNQLMPMYAIDGSLTTRYSTGATMKDGDYFQVDLGSAKMVSGIVVDAATDAADVANGYEVGLSTDGTTFTTVKMCAYNAAAKETINFTATSARYVRYTNKGAPGLQNGATSWMAIHEFNILCN